MSEAVEEQTQDTETEQSVDTNTDIDLDKLEAEQAAEIAKEEAAETTEEETEEPEQPEATVEDIARKFGWRPEDEYRGKRPFVDAATFIKTEKAISDNRLEQIQKLFDSNKELHGKIDSIAQSTKRLKEHQDKLREVEIGKLQKEIEELKYAAVEEGDVEKVKAYDKELDELKESAVEEPPIEEDPEYSAYLAFLSRNPWYDEKSPEYNEELHFIASGMDVRNMSKGLNPIQSLNLIEKEMIEKYIKKKEDPEPTPKPSPKVPGKTKSPVDSGGRKGIKGKRFTVADLDDAQREQAKVGVDYEWWETEQDYVDSLVKSGDLK